MSDAIEDQVLLIYEKRDSAWATRLTFELQKVGLKVLLSPELAHVGDLVPNYPENAQDRIARAQYCLVLWSSLASTSEEVHSEMRRFEESRLLTLKRGGRVGHLIIIDLGGGDVPDLFMEAPAFTDLDTGTHPTPEAVPQEVWNRLTRRIADATTGVAAQPRQRNRRPGATPSTPSPAQATAANDPLRIEHVGRRHRLFPSTQEIISQAPELAGTAINSITTGLILAAISNRGVVTPTPTWAPAWLRSRLGDNGHRRLVEIARSNAEHSQGDTRPAVPVLTPGSDAILAIAQDIARRTSTSDEIHVRHLLGALLADARGPTVSSALGAIAKLEHDIARLRESFFDFVREADDDDDTWGEILLGAKDDSRILPGFDADSDKGADQLDIKPDVMAFAGLIAARTLKPPLSIGLFGEWGSGKTFFMRMLSRQVAFLARHARDELKRNKTRQRDQPYYRRIVQIEFNAWHYADGNLWASLVQHIFDNLRIIDDEKRRASQDLQEPVLQKLQVEKAAEAQAKRELETATSQRDAAVKAVNEAKGEFEKQAKTLAEMSGKNVLADVPSEDVTRAFEPLLAELGITAAITKGVELRATLAEAKTMLGRGQAALVPLLTSRDRERRGLYLVMALIAGPAAALAADAIPRWLGSDGVSTLTAMATGAAGLLASITAWLRHQLVWVGDRLKQIEEVQRKFDQSIEQAQSANLQAIRQAEEQLRLLEADYVAAQRKEEAATRRTLEAEARLKEASVSRLLTTFIEERANSNDYRKHLGMLALVRNDFEKLSDLIAEENDALDGISKRGPDGLDPLPTIDHELKDEEKRINRIVLYIDDLDRCPPAKVVEVLQAVHLLLAFPLFVVVVGVDARWVLRSIEARYRELLKSDGNAAGDGAVNEFKELFGYASAHDYVEKIFQVPFWLKPMSAESSRRLVRDLLKPSVVEPVGSGPATGDRRLPAQGSMMAPPATEIENNTSDRQPSSDPGKQDAATINVESSDREEEPRTPPDLTPAGLEITRAEFDSISDLAPLLGRSPRTLKRFVNVYRLIRVGLSPWDREIFLSDAPGLPDYRAVLLLLAIDTGAPKVATPFFNTVRDLMSSIALEPPREKKGKAAKGGGLSTLIARLGQDDNINALEEWHRVAGWLQARIQNHALPDDVSRFARWIPRVSRFSFHTGRLG